VLAVSLAKRAKKDVKWKHYKGFKWEYYEN